MTTETRPPSHATVELESGRTIELIAIDQFPTYEGMLVGIPTRETNQQKLDRLVARYVDPGRCGVPLLLEPEQRPIDVSRRVPPKGSPAALPFITCVARFTSGGLAGTDDIWSVLRVIWFQDDFAFPIADQALTQLRAVDWETHARRWEP